MPSLRLILSLAAGLVAAGLAGAADAQVDTRSCPDEGTAAKLRQAQGEVEDALERLASRKVFLAAVGKMDTAQTRRESDRLTRAIDADRAELRRRPSPELKARLDDNMRRQTLLTEALARALIDEKVNADRNGYLAQIRAAEADLARAKAEFSTADAACTRVTPSRTMNPPTPRQPTRRPEDGGPPVIYGTPAVGTPIASLQTGEQPLTSSKQPEAYTDQTALTNTPPGQITQSKQPETYRPPPVSTPAPANEEATPRTGGRLRFKKMTDGEAQQMAGQFGDRASTTPGADLTTWAGDYADGIVGFQLSPAGDSAALDGTASDGSQQAHYFWELCKGQGDHVTCGVRGEFDDRYRRVKIAGRLEATWSVTGITGNYVFDTVAIQWKTQPGPEDLKPGSVVPFRYTRQ